MDVRKQLNGRCFLLDFCSVSAAMNKPSVNAYSRIGSGPRGRLGVMCSRMGAFLSLITVL